MNKLTIGQISLIFIFFLMYWQSEFRTFFMETNMGTLLVILLLFVYYYLDRAMGVLFCFMIVFVKYTSQKENFYFYSTSDTDSEDEDSDNLKATEANFRKKHCLHNEVVYKGQTVKNDMIEHVFPEISFRHGACNLCNENCEYDIIEEEDTEEKLHVSTLM